RPSLKTAGPAGVTGLLLSVLIAILTLRSWDTSVPNWHMSVPLMVISLMKGWFARARRCRHAVAGAGGPAEGVAACPGGALVGLDARDRERDRRRADAALSAFRGSGGSRRRGGPPRRAHVRSGRPGRPPGGGNRPRGGRADVRAAVRPPRGPDADV